MKCNYCKRRVRDSFADKLKHVWSYHPDHLISRFQHWPQISFELGSMFGEKLKRKIHAAKNLRIWS